MLYAVNPVTPSKAVIWGLCIKLTSPYWKELFGVSNLVILLQETDFWIKIFTPEKFHTIISKYLTERAAYRQVFCCLYVMWMSLCWPFSICFRPLWAATIAITLWPSQDALAHMLANHFTASINGEAFIWSHVPGYMTNMSSPVFTILALFWSPQTTETYIRVFCSLHVPCSPASC